MKHYVKTDTKQAESAMGKLDKEFSRTQSTQNTATQNTVTLGAAPKVKAYSKRTQK
jgi:hypothetical protein